MAEEAQALHVVEINRSIEQGGGSVVNPTRKTRPMYRLTRRGW